MKHCILLLSLYVPLWSFADVCNVDLGKEILLKTGTGYTAEWTIPDSPALAAPLVTADRNYARTKSWISSHTKLGWRDFILRHMQAVRQAIPNAKADPEGHHEFAVDQVASQLVLDGKLGQVHPIACLEAIPYIEYLKVEDLRKYPQEFWAEVYKKDGWVKIVGNFYLDKSTDPNGTAPTKASEQEHRHLLASGWTYFAHIHDHTFVFGLGEDLGGELVPSGPDFAEYPQLNPEFAIITNGIDTNYMSMPEIMAAVAAMSANH